MDSAAISAGPGAIASVAAARSADGPQNAVQARAKQAAEEFEGVFLSTLLEGMFAGLKTDMPGGGGKSEKMYRSMLAGEYAREISANGGLGIADHVYREILAVQETYQK